MNSNEKMRLTWTVAKTILTTVLIVAGIILTCIMAKNTYDFITNGLFANTGEEYYLPGTEFNNAGVG